MRHSSRIILLIVVALMLAVLVLGTAIELLPAPPGPPTRTAPPALDRAGQHLGPKG